MAITTFTISGTVSGVIADGVTITLTENGGGTPSTVTAGGGLYSFGGITSGSFPLTVTPSLSGYVFSPVSTTFNSAANQSNVNFTSSLAFISQAGAFLVGL